MKQYITELKKLVELILSEALCLVFLVGCFVVTCFLGIGLLYVIGETLIRIL